MKLYYAPGACSMSPHIVAAEAGIPLEIVKVDLMGTRKTEQGEDFAKINPKGYVPVLVTDQGETITEGVAIVLYLAGLKPEAKLAVAPTDANYLKFLEVLLFVTTELHKGMGSLFAPLPEEAKTMIREKLSKRLAYLDQSLAGKSYLCEDRFTAADAYAFTVLGWAPKVGVDLSKWSNLVAFQERVGARPAVQQAMKDEGLPAMKKAA